MRYSSTNFRRESGRWRWSEMVRAWREEPKLTICVHDPPLPGTLRAAIRDLHEGEER